MEYNNKGVILLYYDSCLVTGYCENTEQKYGRGDKMGTSLIGPV